MGEGNPHGGRLSRILDTAEIHDLPASDKGAQGGMIRIGLPALLEPGYQRLVVDAVQRGKPRAAQPAGLIGFDKRLLLLRSVAQASAPVSFQNHFIHIRHSGRIYDGYERPRANSYERCFGPRLR